MAEQICMIVYSYYPVDARPRREAETLASFRGRRVSVLSLKQGASPRTYQMEGVTVRELDIGKYRGKSGLRYIASYLRFTFLAFLACTKLFLKRRIDVVHVHNLPDFLVFAAIVPRLFGKKLILDIHDTFPETYVTKFRAYSTAFQRIVFKALCLEERVCSALAHKIICVNHVQRDVLVRRGVPPEKVAISMNVPDHHRFNLGSRKKRAREDSEGFKIVYHGLVAERLGVDLAIRAVARLVDQIPGLEFCIWGYGEDLDEMMQLVTKLGMEDHVHLDGILVPLDTLPVTLADMDLGIVGNRRSAATELMLPVKMLECVALDIPVVAPRLKAIEYYFSENMVGYFEPDSIDSMVSAVLKLYRSRSGREKQAERARVFLDTHGWEKHQLDLVELYDDLLKP
jgi:glycosyltransferase involved in cell wall biosynthesis